MAIRVHSSSAGLDPSNLRAGEDLVLEVDMAHGFDLADGVGVRDHLSNRDRHEIDALALEGLNAWRRVWDEALTIDGIVWPFVLELELLSHFIPVVADAVGLDRALRHYGAREVVLADDRQRTERLLAVVAPRSDLAITHAARSLKPAEWARAGRSPLPRRLRNAFFKTLTTKLGAPTRLREGNVMIVSYWPMMPLFDALLADPQRRPAVVLTAPPTGPRRSLAAARQGGFVGRPGPWRRAGARRAAEAALGGGAGSAPEIELAGLSLGAELHRTALEVMTSQLATRVGAAAMLRDAFARQRTRHVVIAFDDAPSGRLVAVLAREARIPSTLIQHGAYFLPCVVPDLTLADQVAIWSEAVVLQPSPQPRFHAVGYPLADQPRPARPRRSPGHPPRVVVLPQPWHPSTAALDGRVWMRHCVTAIETVRDAVPDAEVVLRPHPSDPANLAPHLADRFPGLTADSRTPILELLAGCDLCVGGTSTATLQAALVATPVIFLDVSGQSWNWPFGGDTPVPIAQSAAELADWLTRWRSEGELPGSEALLSALGADRPDPTARLLTLLDNPSQPAQPPGRPLVLPTAGRF